ncbi:N-acetylglucosamine-6-phosphate deacetylase [Aliiroseovarius sp. KMU-50]|uniref:N-acetylglucosamine-6-phosphate deacetylase n=1 Tax=Aliiroseovarius salicola TaxID=3009082 RepID=A0ABT4W4Z9_9RHOB|nr:N-acetylglucosamine-6-phosphate deacetylase [Aliiroseovarius sp. KMU-50]MDA5095596.1 N-acetylglucosamine-6-phosphate deacetylase [Aliiroseovarius sp. KMU-50]
MSGPSLTIHGGMIFDGEQLCEGLAARFERGQLTDLAPQSDLPPSEQTLDLAGDILSPGYVDLQVNGGDGVMLNDAPDVDTLSRIARAHRGLGAQMILPTLITDTAEKTRAAIDAATRAVERGVPGIAGLHLEGPHLSIKRKGAHEARFIRPMDEDDLQTLLAAAEALPVLMVTLAPENATTDQVHRLHEAGVIVSLGHTDADYDTCQEYARAGATCATHLFNAMSQLGSRTPGLVGAVLENEGLAAGLIADGVHVHPATMRAAWTANQHPDRNPTDPTGRIFLVTDSMAVAGTDNPSFELEGRLIKREDGRLTLEDGTLAGADLDLTRAVKVLTQEVGVSLVESLLAATTHPAALIGKDVSLAVKNRSRIETLIRIRADLGGVSWLMSTR